MSTAKFEQLRNSSPEAPVAETAQLWRYVPLKTLFYYLSGRVFIPSVKKLQEADRFEAQLPMDDQDQDRQFRDAFRETYGEDAEAVDQWIYSTLCTDKEREVFSKFKILNRERDPASESARFHRPRYMDFIYRTRYAWCWFESANESAAMWFRYGQSGVAIRSSPVKLGKVLNDQGFSVCWSKIHAVNRVMPSWTRRPSKDPGNPRFLSLPGRHN